jgi:hypothetical protein
MTSAHVGGSIGRAVLDCRRINQLDALHHGREGLGRIEAGGGLLHPDDLAKLVLLIGSVAADERTAPSDSAGDRRRASPIAER